MAISLYDAVVPGYLQTLGATAGFLAKSEAHFAEAGVSLDDIVEARLHETMLPFRFQVHMVAHQSLGAINGVKAGVFSPPSGLPKSTYAELRGLIDETITAVSALDPAEINTLESKDVTFKAGAFELPFTAEGFLLSFSVPNLHFHATTAYDILRLKGAPLGKPDYVGQLRLKG